MITAATASTPATTTMPAIRRARSDIGVLLGLAEAVAHAADRLDQPGVDVVDLAAEVADVGLDDAAVPAEVVLPDVVEDLRLGHDAPLVHEEVAEQVVLGG